MVGQAWYILPEPLLPHQGKDGRILSQGGAAVTKGLVFEDGLKELKDRDP